MKAYIRVLTVLFIFSVTSLIAEVETIKVVTQSPISIGKTKVALSKIVSLSSKAIQAGYDEILLKGSVKYKRLPNKRTRVKINWSSIKQTIGTTENNIPLSSSMTSQFIIDEKRVDPGTELTAKGDLESLSRSLDEALTAALRKEANSNNTSDDDSTSSNKRSAQKINSPSNANIGGGYSDPTNGNNPNGGGTTGSGAKLTITSYETCSPRIDKSSGYVYEQQQKVTTLETGEETGRDACADKGTSAQIVKTYETCPILEDIQNGFVYKKYKETALLNNNTILVTDCTVDFSQKLIVKNDYSVCGKRHDFINGVSIQQEQFYYIDDSNSRVDLGDCVDSSVTYTQYLTLNTCTATVDAVNGFVFPQKRVAYQLKNGTIEYATACAPVETDKVALTTEFCAQKYEHDFTSGQSYLRKQSFYNDFQTNEKIIVGACSRDTTISFAHVFEQIGCATVNDDALLKTTWNSNTQIDASSVGDGIIEIAPCQVYGAPTPYAYTGTGTDSVSNGSFPSAIYWGTKTANQWFGTTLSGATMSAQSVGTWKCAGLQFKPTSGAYSFGTTTAFSVGCVLSPASGYAYNSIVYMTLDKDYTGYLRGDGTTYKKYTSKIGRMLVESGNR